jgi:hypothetical protein
MTALAVDALTAVRAAGGDVRLLSTHRLKIVAPRPLPDALIELVRAAKPELLNLLATSSAETWGSPGAPSRRPRLGARS